MLGILFWACELLGGACCWGGVLFGADEWAFCDWQASNFSLASNRLVCWSTNRWAKSGFISSQTKLPSLCNIKIISCTGRSSIDIKKKCKISCTCCLLGYCFEQLKQKIDLPLPHPSLSPPPQKKNDDSQNFINNNFFSSVSVVNYNFQK